MEDIFAPIFEAVGSVFSYVYRFFFETAFPLSLQAGEYCFNSIYSWLCPYINNGKWISAVIGMFIFFPIARLIINTIRG